MSVEEIESPLELNEEEIRLAEAHRGFVREMDQQMGQAYGMGGAAVIVVMSLIGAGGWLFGVFFQPSLWVFGITAALGTLFLGRKKIYQRRDKLKERVESYCEINEVSPRLLTDYYRSEQMYPFFTGIFEEGPRRIVAERPAAEH